MRGKVLATATFGSGGAFPNTATLGLPMGQVDYFRLAIRIILRSSRLVILD